MPSLTHTRTWEGTLKTYVGLVERNNQFQPMLDLVEKIAASVYNGGIHPATSMFKLIVSQAPAFEWQREVLEIEFDPVTEQFEFVFWEHPKTKPWISHCPAADGFQRFERCIAVKKWFA